MHTDLLHLQRYHDSGDAGEFQALVRHHAGMVFATARRVTRDPSLAEDVAQETSRELARKGRSITESVGAWLHRVAWRRACDVVRAETTRQRYETAAHDLSEGRECTWEELEPVFDEAIAELVVEQRTAIIEHYLEGRTQTELAARMGMSQSSVSRLLDQSITALRAKLKTKGLLCGAAFGAMIAASSTQAAPAALMASLHKIGVSSIGSGAAAATTGTALLGGLMGLNLKIAAAVALAVAACVAGLDLASKDSWIASWLGQKPPAAAATDAQGSGTASAPAAPNAEDPVAKKARLLAEAKAIWANKPKLTKAEMERLFAVAIYERDPEKKWAAFLALGITLPRAEYDRILARHPDILLFDERQSLHAMSDMFNDIFGTWCQKSPREAIVWGLHRGASGQYWFPPTMAAWVRSHPDEWAAFVEAGPDPRIGNHASLWIEDLDDPGSIWAKAKDAGLSFENIGEGIYALISTGAPVESIYGLIMRAPDAKVRNKYIMAIATKLTPDQLLQVASSGLFEEGLSDTLRAMGGDPKARFGIAAAWVTKAVKGGGLEAQNATWTTEAIGPFYAGWLKRDARTALQHAVRTDNKRILELFMAACAQSPLLTEQLMAKSFTSPINRERALAAYCQSRAGGDPKAALQSIMNSTAVVDQIECAKNVLVQWTIQSPADAGAWVAGLIANEDRDELMVAVATQWAGTAPEAAIAYAQKQGLGLAHGWSDGLAWGARNLPEDKFATILAPLHSDPEYNRMLTRLVGYRASAREAVSLLTKYAEPGWQALVVQDTTQWLGGEDSRAEEYAQVLPTLDLSEVDPQIVNKAANLFIQRLAAKGKLQPALDWTLKLPAPIAAQVRQQAIASLPRNDPKQRATAEHWIRTASISDSERATLLQQPGRDAQTPTSSR